MTDILAEARSSRPRMQRTQIRICFGTGELSTVANNLHRKRFHLIVRRRRWAHPSFSILYESWCTGTIAKFTETIRPLCFWRKVRKSPMTNKNKIFDKFGKSRVSRNSFYIDFAERNFYHLCLCHRRTTLIVWSICRAMLLLDYFFLFFYS